MSSEAPPVTQAETDNIVGTARLLTHIKENNVSWMIGMLVAYQMGILDKALAYGSGMC